MVVGAFSSALTDRQRLAWQCTRRSRRGSAWARLPQREGALAWGNPRCAWGAALAALVFVAVAYLVGGGRIDGAVWPLWVMASVFALVIPVNLLCAESFSLDAQARRWRYRRGWGCNVRTQEGSCAELVGLVLEAFRAPAHNPDFHVVVLEFADGLRLCDLTPALYDPSAARAEAREISTLAGLPLRERAYDA